MDDNQVMVDGYAGTPKDTQARATTPVGITSAVRSGYFSGNVAPAAGDRSASVSETGTVSSGDLVSCFGSLCCAFLPSEDSTAGERGAAAGSSSEARPAVSPDSDLQLMHVGWILHEEEDVTIPEGVFERSHDQLVVFFVVV